MSTYIYFKFFSGLKNIICKSNNTSKKSLCKYTYVPHWSSTKTMEILIALGKKVRELLGQAQSFTLDYGSFLKDATSPNFSLAGPTRLYCRAQTHICFSPFQHINSIPLFFLSDTEDRLSQETGNFKSAQCLEMVVFLLIFRTKNLP